MLAEKVGDVKLRAPAAAALSALAEALGPKFVIAQLHKRTATHKNPKVRSGVLQVGRLNQPGSTALGLRVSAL